MEEQPVVKRYFMELGYDGSSFSGWQIQPNGITVQESIEKAMSTIAQKPVSIVGAGRTDAGVHATRMVAHFDFEGDTLPFDAHKINRLLPRTITIYRIYEVATDAHARFDAVERTYHYRIHFNRDPFLRHVSTFVHHSLDIEAMNRAALFLLGEQDFTSFSKLHTDVKTNICSVKRAEWVREEGEGYRFEITADRFLRDMVRAIVGTLFLIGRGKMAPEAIRNILEQKDRSAAGMSAPAEGLSLVDVKYNF